MNCIIADQPNGVTSPKTEVNLKMTQNGACISDDEANSWDDEVTDSEDQQDYGDDDYDEEIAMVMDKADLDEEDAVEEDPEEEEVPEVDEELEIYGAEDDDIPMNKRLVMNVYCTEYDVVKKVARKVCNYKLREYREDHDGAIRRG